MLSGREAVILGSFWRSMPAVVLRGFAKRGLPAASCSALTRSKSTLRRNTSPRTSSQSGGCSVRRRGGMARIVRTLGVTSSPTSPSPRVAPRVSTPRS